MLVDNFHFTKFNLLLHKNVPNNYNIMNITKSISFVCSTFNNFYLAILYALENPILFAEAVLFRPVKKEYSPNVYPFSKYYRTLIFLAYSSF